MGIIFDFFSMEGDGSELREVLVFADARESLSVGISGFEQP